MRSSSWFDIEDDATLCGDIDVENFPTLAVFRDATVLHYGVSLPYEGTVDLLLSELSNRLVAIAAPPDEAATLAARLLRGDDRSAACIRGNFAGGSRTNIR